MAPDPEKTEDAQADDPEEGEVQGRGRYLPFGLSADRAVGFRQRSCGNVSVGRIRGPGQKDQEQGGGGVRLHFQGLIAHGSRDWEQSREPCGVRARGGMYGL